MTRMINNTTNNSIEEYKHKLNLMEKEKHDIFIMRQKTEAKLGEFRAKYETEKRKNQELQRQVSEDKNKLKLLKNENKKYIKSDEEKIRRLEKLQKTVKERDQVIQILEKSLEELKSNNTVLRHQVSDYKALFSDKVAQLQQSLAMLKELKDEQQKTINERDCECDKRKVIERKLIELESNASSYMNNLRKELETATDQLTKLTHKHNLAVSKLDETEKRFENVRSNTIEGKDSGFEKCNENVEKSNTQKLSEQISLKRLEEVHVKSDPIKERQELKTTKDQYLKLQQEHQFVFSKLKETEDKLNEANNKNIADHRSRQDLKTKLLELQHCIKDLRETKRCLENEVELKESSLQALKRSFESLQQECLKNNQQREMDFQNNAERLSELRRREETILEELNKARLERDKNKSEIESEKRKVKELENKLEAEFEHTTEKRLEEVHVKSDIGKLRRECSTTNDRLLKLKQEHEFVVTKLKDTEDMLDEAKNENQVETRTRQELKTKLIELENCIKDLREANKHLENEVELKDSNLQGLKVRLESLKQECHENSQQRERDFQNSVKQLSEQRLREKTILEELNKVREERDENKSETEVEKRKVTELKKRVNGYENQMKQSKDENDEIFRVHSQELAQLEKEVKKRDRELEDLTKSLKQIKHQNNEQSKQIHTLMETREHFKNKLQIAENLLHETTDREHGVTKEFERKRKEYEDGAKYLEETNKQLIFQKDRIQDLEKEAVCKDRNIKILQKSLEDANREINEKNKLMQDLTESTRNRMKEAEAELNAVKAVNAELRSKVNNPVSELNDQLQKTLSKLEKTQAELEETKTRLSKAMGDRLTDNNPNIADLSDKNRPVKLAERYSELYDNQWTDAYDVLEKRFEREQQTIESLLEILQDASRFCEVNAVKQLEDLQRSLLFTKAVVENFPTGVLKLLKDCRKRMSSAAIKDLYEMYMSHLKMSHPDILKNAKDISEFVRKCLELCWLMAIQDPTVVLAPVAQPGSDFNTDIYRAYTSSGKQVDYTVWPAMLLHKGGPILSKGIAQGYGKKTSKFKSS